MKTYGQFCPLALALETVGERWTPLVVREIMLGSHRFNDIQRGVPRMSPALLSRRLRTLENAGVVRREITSDGHGAYVLTDAGEALAPIVKELAVWSKYWLPATLSRDRADPDLIMWDMHKRLATERMPGKNTVIRFGFLDQPQPKRYRWLVRKPGEVELCMLDPGAEPDLFVSTDSETMTLVWYGDVPIRSAIADGRIVLDGPRDLRSSFPNWLRLSVMAEFPRRAQH